MMSYKIAKNNQELAEEKRIAEMKSLTYLERLERLMIIIEVSSTLREANRISIEKTRILFNNF